MKIVKFIKYNSKGKPLTQKQKERYEKHFRTVMEDFDEVWGDDLEWLDWIENLSEDKSDNPKTI